jgi:hypothetical protein
VKKVSIVARETNWSAIFPRPVVFQMDCLKPVAGPRGRYEQAVGDWDWARAVSFDQQFHSLLTRFHQNRRLEAFHQKLIGEL